MNRTFAILIVVGISVACIVREVQAGFVTTGASSFGVGGDAGGDATVNFVTYRNDGLTGDWVTDLGGDLSITFLDGMDRRAEWVFFYQVNNTDPLGLPEFPLFNFNVTVTAPDGSPVAGQPYTSGGYDDYLAEPENVFNVFNMPDLDAPLDVPNDWKPSSPGPNLDPPPFKKDPNAIDPASLTLTGPNDFSISNPNVNVGVGYNGATFNLGGIGAGQNSTILFLTTNYEPKIVWAETETSGLFGFSAAGDVAGAAIPESSSFAQLSLVAMTLASIYWWRRIWRASGTMRICALCSYSLSRIRTTSAYLPKRLSQWAVVSIKSSGE